MRVAKWGNSLAVRLPTAVVEALELNEGDELDIQLAGKRQLDVSRRPERQEVVARLRELLKGRLPDDFKFNRDDLYGP